MENKKLLSTLFFITISAQVWAFKPPSCQTLNQKWSNQYYSDFKVKWPKSTNNFSCVSEKSRVAETLYYLENMQIDDPIQDYYAYVKRGLKGLRYVKENSTFKWAYASEINGIITLHGGFVADNSKIQRVQKIIHEARHVRSQDPGHRICIRGSSKGKAACDAEFHPILYSGSGYNFGFKFLKMLNKDSKNHDLSRKSAIRRMKWMVSNRFNQITNEQIRQYSK